MIDAGLLVHGGRGSDGAVLQDIAIFDCRAQRWVLHHDSGFPCCAHVAANTAAAAAAAAEAARSSAAAAAAAGGGAADAGGGQPGGARASVAANVLLYGGFTGEQVSGDLLQLNFLRQHARGEGGGGEEESPASKRSTTWPIS